MTPADAKAAPAGPTSPTPPPVVSEPAPPPASAPADVPAAPRTCEPGERLDAGCTPPAARKKRRACRDGEFLASGCRCDDTTCMDICCVGSACSHHASEDGGWAKCMRRR